VVGLLPLASGPACLIHYNTIALPVLLYGSETWTTKARDARRITAAEMKYIGRTAGYTWTDYKTNTQITKELKITQILYKLLECKRNWIQHVNRMPRNRLSRVMKHYSTRVSLFSWRYNPLWLYFHSPVAGFSLLVFEVS
jgi:hypothetical protein